jgi:hypothetical protein
MLLLPIADISLVMPVEDRLSEHLVMAVSKILFTTSRSDSGKGLHKLYHPVGPLYRYGIHQ